MNWWKIAYTTAVLTGVFVIDDSTSCCQTVDAFFATTSHQIRNTKSIASIEVTDRQPKSLNSRWKGYNPVCKDSSSRTKVLFVGSTGWDNENFLESLSKGNDAIEKANEEYRKQSRFANMRPASADENDEDDLGVGGGMLGNGAVDNVDDNNDGIKDMNISKDQVERIKQQNEEDSGSGEMFKKMLERAQQGATLKSTMQPPELPPPTASESSTPVLPEGFHKLSVEAQAALFRQLMVTPAREQWPAAPGPRPEAKGQAMVAADGRKIGRNKDADSLVNTSDVYFAQLKLDSAVRNQARREGDSEKADAVFADPNISDLKLHVNPYLEEQRKKELEMLETAADEMFTPELLSELKKEVKMNDRGVSFKEMLEQKRKATQQQRNDNSNMQPTTPPRRMESPAMSAAVTQVQPVVALPQTSHSVSPSKSEDEIRRDIRTLMGLLIKHRGGPGFGAGRIVGAEMERFATLSSEVVSLLQTEYKNMSPERSTMAQDTQFAFVPLNEAKTNVPATPVGDRMNGVLACIEGAITMYKNSPPELQQSVVMTLRAALLSALNACNEILAIQEVEQVTSYQTSANERMNSVLTVIEGAIAMYKNSPPELQQSVLVTLRVALSSAVTACNEVIAVSEVQQYEAYRTPPTDQRARDNNPIQYSERLSLSTSTSVPPIQEYRAERTDENAAFLESVYHKLKDAAGDGKMGLRQDLNAAEAEDLANDISHMRALLVEELNGSGTQREPSSQPPAAAQYKQMLAKVRADKDAAGKN